MNAPRPPLRPLDEALAELLGHAKALAETESVSTFDADGRVLARDLVSALQIPPQDNSAMDGYAVRTADITSEGIALPLSQRIPAGSVPTPLAPGSVARIFTGATIPEGADAVVMQEDTEPAGEQLVRFKVVPSLSQSIRRSGEDVARGAVVLAAGQRLDAASLGMAAGIGMASLDVARKPRVALFSTGDELVMPGTIAPEQMKPGTIYNSNRFFLRTLLARLNCEVTDLGIVPDRYEATVDALRDASQHHDLILTSGGVSVGEEDHVKPAVQALGSLDLWQIAVKPGKPFAYGTVGGAHFIGLPGNPVSSFVTFLLLVRPFLLKLQGASRLQPTNMPVKASFTWPKSDKRREFLRAKFNAEGSLDLFTNQGSGVLTSMVWGDGLVDIAPGATIAHGDAVRFLPFSELFA